MTARRTVRRSGDWALPAVLIAVAILVWTIPLQRVGIWAKHQNNPDVFRYRDYAQAIVHGALAYRDVRIEYPPGATGLFTLVWWIPGNYRAAFAGLMLVCLCVCLVGVVQTARALGYSPLRQAIAGGIVALSPLLLGSLVQARFDLVVAAVTAWMLYAAVTERWKLMWVLLTAGILIKLIPLALLPLLVIWHARRVHWRAALRGAIAAVVIVAAVVVPFAIATPSGTWYFIAYNLRRPPQIESIVSSAFLAAHTLSGTHIEVLFTYGSMNIGGQGPRLATIVMMVLLVAFVVGIAIRCAHLLARAHPTRAAEIVVAGSAATMLSLMIGSKVFSPQYMVWLVPVIPLLPGRLWRAATITLVAALVLTQAFFPLNYLHLIELHDPEIALLVARNVAVIILLALCWPRRGLGTLPIAGQTIGTAHRDAHMTGPATSVPARHIVD